jgi:monothiol glutaredoxin
MTDQASAFKKINGHLAKDKIVLYMKGTKEAPRCGFSAQAVQVLKAHNKPFVTYDVLSDEELWNHLDEHSGWETFPQVFIDGKLIGGCDIVTEMHTSGELKTLIETSFAKPVGATK